MDIFWTTIDPIVKFYNDNSTTINIGIFIGLTLIVVKGILFSIKWILLCIKWIIEWLFWGKTSKNNSLPAPATEDYSRRKNDAISTDISTQSDVTIKNVKIVNIQQPDKPTKLTPEHFKRMVELERKNAIEEFKKASDDTKSGLLRKINELNRRFANPKIALKETQERIDSLETIIEREGNKIEAELLKKTRIAIEKGNFSKADKLFARIEEHEELDTKSIAKAAFARGEIAEQQIRMQDAIKHYTKAAELDPCFKTLTRVQRFAHDIKKYSLASSFGENATKAAILEYGEGSKEHATSLNNLAVLYHEQQQYEKAVSLNEQVLKIREKALGKNHHSIAITLNNLAEIYYEQGRYEEAKSLHIKSLQIRTKAFGENDQRTAVSINNLAQACKMLGDYKEAESLHVKCLKIRRDILVENHPDIASSLNNLAQLYIEREQYNKAEPLLDESLQIHQEIFGANHPSTGININNIGGFYYSQKQYKKAETFVKKSLKIYIEFFGETHPYTATCSNNLAGIYREQGQYKKAEPLFKKAIKSFETIYGSDHHHTKIVKKNYETLKELKANAESAASQ